MPRFLTVLCSLLWVMTTMRVGASSDAPSSVAGYIDLEALAGGGFHLKVDQATTGDVLDRLSSQVGIPIVHGHEREEPITLACSSSTIKPLLECLLGSSANVLYIAAGSASSKSPSDYERIVILSSSRRDLEPTDRGVSSPSSLAPKVSLPLTPSGDLLMAMLKDSDSTKRIDALSLLGQSGGMDQETRRSLYQAALNDENGEVRGSALSGLARLGDPSSPSLIANGVIDPDPSVRLAAIEALPLALENRNYLESALADTDPIVRQLAQIRLAAMPQ